MIGEKQDARLPVPVRLFHFSDLHLGVFPRGLGWLFDKRLLGVANHWLRRACREHLEYLDEAGRHLRAFDPTCVVCTGDLTSVGLESEFELAYSALSSRLGVDGSRPVLFVPGNHDRYCQASVSASNKCYERLNHSFGLQANTSLPLIRLGDLSLFLLDGALPRPWHLSTGEFSSSHSSCLETYFGLPRHAGEHRVLVSHFPLFGSDGRGQDWHHGLHGASVLRDWARSGLFDMCLCGHIHKPYIYRLDNGFTEVCAGSLTLHGHIAEITLSHGILTASLVDCRKGMSLTQEPTN